jgi:YidC/Oxa1 family membrane protein insertase
MADSPNNLPGPGSGKKKDLSMEMRLLIAFILMGAVLFLTPYLSKPAAPPRNKPAAPAAITQKPAESQAAEKAQPAPVRAAAAAPKPRPGQIAAGKEEAFEIETGVYRVRFSNRGAVVQGWVLKDKKYVDSGGHPLEVVNQASVKTAGYPFALEFKGQKPATDLNQALYVARRSPDGLGVDFEFSDGRTLARKSFQFTRNGYLSRVGTEVLQNGVELPHLVVWRGGFGDPTAENPASVQHSLHYDLAAGKLVVNEAKKAKDGPLTETGQFSFAGLEDHYFAAVFLPGPGAASVEAMTFSDQAPVPSTGKEEPHVGTAVGGAGQNAFSLFVGPKDVNLLKRVDPKLTGLIDWGWFWFLAEPLFVSLNWVNDHLTRNFGWGIILVTIAINLLMLPLRMTSMKSMRKMAVIQPQVAAINEKYKGIGMRDPKRSQQNEEVMALYKKHGVNPAGGCVPMLLQIPFFFAFYKVLTVAIELRGAQWLWVSDLSLPETLPIRVLPVTMVVAQFIQQKMTPSTSPDPTQQKMMLMMPLMLGFFFYGVSSGLVLYWLTGNVIGIAQQMVFNRLAAAPVADKTPAPHKKGARK